MNPPCNSCGGELYGPIASTQLTAEVGEVWFDCLDCDQKVGVAPSGRGWQIILPMLYPTRRSPRMEHEYANHEGAERVFLSKLRLAAGFIDDETHECFVEEVAGAVERYKDEHPVTPGLRERLKAVFT